MKLIKTLVYSNFYVALCAALMSDFTFLFMQLDEHRWSYFAFTFFGTFFIYNFQRLFRMEKKKYKELSGQLMWADRNRTYISLTSWLSGIIAGSLFFLFPAKLIFYLLPTLVLSVFYAVPFNLKEATLRDIPFLKIVIIGLVWAVVGVLIPFQLNERPFDSFFSLLFLHRFLFIIAIALPFDIRDMKCDFKSGIKTIPLFIGIKNTRYLSAAIILISAIIFSKFCVDGSIENPLVIGVLFAHLVTAMIVVFSSEERNELFYSGIVEGTMIIVYLPVFMLS